MKQSWMRCMFFITAIVSCLFVISPVTLTKEIKQEWEILNPEGVIKIEAMKINSHPSTLDGKTIMLRWNGKHNGDKFLERVGELLEDRVKDVKVIKSWEVAPETLDPFQCRLQKSEKR